MAIKRSRNRDNAARFAGKAAAYIKKDLREIADKYDRDITKIVEEKLITTFKANLVESYIPRSAGTGADINFNITQKQREAKEGYQRRLGRRKIPYTHTHTLEENLYVVTENNTTKIKLRDVPYKDDPDGATTTKVYKYLTEGTGNNVGQIYAYTVNGKTSRGRNYPTPVHEFEAWTAIEMRGFMDTLKIDLQSGKYRGRKYAKKKGR